MHFGHTLPVEVGDTLAGKYRVDAVVGAGGMGVVLAATHLDLDRKVAVKLIRPELTEDPAIVERLMLEARAAAAIRSEHVGAVLDVGRLDNGAPYIVMEFLEGSDLGALLESRGALPVIDAVDVVMQVCEALAHAHQRRIVHRDLKPENLFLVTAPDGTKNVKVLDFGIAKQLGGPSERALTNPATAVGSPQYMAPEQMQAREIDVRVDIWALGAILYETLSGQRAFDGDLVAVICAKVLSEQPVPLREAAPHVPDALAAVVTRCLSKAPAERFADVAELAKALAPFGSLRAQAYLPRVLAVLDYPTGDPESDVRKLGYDGTVVGNSGGAGPSRTERGVTVPLSTDTAPAQPQSSKRPRPALWPVWVGAGVAALAAASVWLFAREKLEEEAAARAENANLSATPTDTAPPHKDEATPPAVATRSEQIPGMQVQPVMAPDAGQPDAPLDDATRPGAPTETTRRVVSPRTVPPHIVPQPARRPAAGAPPPQQITTPPAGSESDAWDPDNFGGRH